MGRGIVVALNKLILVAIILAILAVPTAKASNQDRTHQALSATTYQLQSEESLWSVGIAALKKAGVADPSELNHPVTAEYTQVVSDTVLVIVHESQSLGLLPADFDPWGKGRLTLPIGQRLAVPDDLLAEINELHSKPKAVKPRTTVPTPTLTYPQTKATGCPTATMSGLALAMFNANNDQRTKNGEPALTANGCVIYIAQLRSDDMATRNYFSHTSPDSTGAFYLLDAYGVPHGWAGENLARNNYSNNQTVAVAIHDLMASPGHRDNLLSPNYTQMGVGFANDGTGMKYFTMIFIGPPL